MQRVRWTPPPEDALFAAGHSKGSGDVKHFLDDPIEWKDLLDWQKDNEHLVTGYRQASYSIRKSIRTILRLHNETINIWSHIIGAAVFFLWPTYTYLQVSPHYKNARPGDKTTLLIYFLGVIVCFALSSAFHTLSNHSKEIRKLTSHADQLGIVVVMWGSTIASDHFGFYCNPELQAVYMLMATVIATGCGVFTMDQKYQAADYRALRVAAYCFLAISAFVPVAHGVYVNGWEIQNRRQSLTYFIGIGLLDFTGAAIYVARIPERWTPRRFDIFGSSHQIMHVFVILGAWCNTVGVVKAFDYWHWNTITTKGAICNAM